MYPLNRIAKIIASTLCAYICMVPLLTSCSADDEPFGCADCFYGEGYEFLSMEWEEDAEYAQNVSSMSGTITNVSDINLEFELVLKISDPLTVLSLAPRQMVRPGGKVQFEVAAMDLPQKSTEYITEAILIPAVEVIEVDGTLHYNSDWRWNRYYRHTSAEEISHFDRQAFIEEFNTCSFVAAEGSPGEPILDYQTGEVVDYAPYICEPGYAPPQ